MATRRKQRPVPAQLATPATTTTTCRIFLPGKPTTASRPRVARAGWAYYAKSYKEWRERAEASLAAYASLPCYVGPLEVFIEILVQLPKKTERAFPRGDLDNYAKGPLDVFTKAGIWPDDDCVVKLTVTKRYTGGADEDEGVLVIVSPA